MRQPGGVVNPRSLIRLYRDSAQGEPKTVLLRDPERSVLQYVSTGSAQKCRLQAALG